METINENRKAKTRLTPEWALSFSFFVFRYSIFVFSALWRWLREVSGDDAYERYEATHSDAVSRLSPREFYRQRMERKFTGPCRCC